jgi:hypothetical protein
VCEEEAGRYCVGLQHKKRLEDGRLLWKRRREGVMHPGERAGRHTAVKQLYS